MIIIYINNMTIAILIHKSVNCKCESMKSVNKDDEGREGASEDGRRFNFRRSTILVR